jgi:hypothetical protein
MSHFDNFLAKTTVTCQSPTGTCQTHQSDVFILSNSECNPSSILEEFLEAETVVKKLENDKLSDLSELTPVNVQQCNAHAQ